MACYGLYIIQRLPAGSMWIIMLFILVWSADTFAYFIGKKWGHKSLAPLISPKKTVAGFWGGLLGALLLSLVVFVLLKNFTNKIFFPPLIVWISIAYITILLAILGDLFESLVKRLTGVKDSGKLLPGHGGVLDRLDSLVGALPFYALSLAWVTK
jgi:phosphatidate cytidylyltransferase